MNYFEGNGNVSLNIPSTVETGYKNIVGSRKKCPYNRNVVIKGKINRGTYINVSSENVLISGVLISGVLISGVLITGVLITGVLISGVLITGSTTSKLNKVL